jgi:iron complex outermembrane receptor protein
LVIGVNYFNVVYENQIVNFQGAASALTNPSLYPAGVVTNCPSTACTDLVNRYVLGVGPDPQKLPILSGNSIINGTPGVFIDGTNRNAAVTKTHGMDLDIRYRLPFERFGAIGLSFNGTYNFNFEQATFDGAPLVARLNTTGFPSRFRARGGINWRNGPWSGNVSIAYVNSYLNTGVTPNQTIDANKTVNLNLGYSVETPGWLNGFRVGVNVTNLFDAEPPFVSNTTGYDTAQGDPIGRMTSVSLTKRF